MGTGSRGSYLLKHLKPIDTGKCVAICDISDDALDKGAQTIGGNPKRYKDAMAKAARHALAAVEIEAQSAGIDCRTMSATGDLPWEVIIRTAQGGKSDRVVMAPHGRRGFSALLLGSETHKVLTHSKIPVLVYR